MARTLLGPDDLEDRLRLGLVGAQNEEQQSFLVRHAGAVHLVVEDGVAHRAHVPLQLMQPQLEVPAAIAFIEHYFFCVDCPAFRENT